jgi:hypothetical protein
MAKKKIPPIAITALVFGIISFVFCWIPVINILLSLTALILGIISITRISKDSSLEGKGLAIAAIVLGTISILLGMLILIGMLAYFGVLSPSRMMPP